LMLPSPNTYVNKLKNLNSLKHEIKKKRIFFDESKEFFGFDVMTQLIKVKNTSEIKGYPFLINNKHHRFGLKVIPVENKYEKHEHPSYLEYIILKYLTENIVNKQISPHFVHFLGQFKVSNKIRAIKHINLKRLEVENQIRTHSNVVISEFVEGKSLDNWLHDTYEADDKISNLQWKVIVFQMIYTIYIMQVYFKLMHNDFHYGNILIDNTIKKGGYYVYKVNNKVYYIPNTGILPKLFDFEYAMVYSNKMDDTYPNKFIMGHCVYDKSKHISVPNNSSSDDDDDNVPCNYNEVYDVHYFLTSLLDLFISEELFNWVLQVYPDEVIPPDESTTDSSSSDDTSSNSSSDDTSSDSSSDTSSESSNDSESSSDSESSEDTSDDSESESSHTEFIKDGRLINGVENKIKLPKPLELLENDFFKEFLVKPDDFDESTAVYFTCEK
jgi:hypothetical protein